ncbi:peptidase, M23 family [Prevotella amnii CRIS 21A-A]|uniref:Peptidase, M23 family n=1 Tax=Prevotella amnii CRIS 21A-A TaxID=679191 RepID=E1GXI2_9BACT|nr:M23 family metallopeptidase [Prevotella amnii]EFN90686.1 peptidase, M23 family [Prevotella amnii CRIS 21A-A]
MKRFTISIIFLTLSLIALFAQKTHTQIKQKTTNETSQKTHKKAIKKIPAAPKPTIEKLHNTEKKVKNIAKKATNITRRAISKKPAEKHSSLKGKITPNHLKGKAATKEKQNISHEKGKKANIRYITTSAIKDLREKNQAIQKEIQENELQVKKKQKDVDQRLQKIMLLDTEIGQQQKTIDQIATDVKGINGNIEVLKGQLKSLQTQLTERRKKFILSMRYMARHRSIQDKIMFIFSAKSLSQMYRRLRFVREYASYQRAQGELLKAKQAQVDNKHIQLKQVRGQKYTLLYKDRQAHAQMQSKRLEQQQVVNSLKKDQQTLQTVIAQRRKTQQTINAQIDKLVAIEIQKARIRAQAEARAQAAARAAAAKKRAEDMARKREAAIKAAQENARRVAEAKAREAKAKAMAEAAERAAEKERREAAEKAEKARQEAEKARQAALQEASARREAARKKAEDAERKAKEAQQQAEKKAAAEKALAYQQAREAEANRIAAERKAAADKERAAREAEAARKANTADNNLTNADRAMTGSFANNRGRLPMPMAGKIVTHFGQYNVAGMSNIRLNSNGINIKGAAGSPVRSVFMGEVSGIFNAGGSTIVMVRHGIYISVYCNLANVSVHRGQNVGTGQTLGTVNSTGVLHFQLRKETAKLNPEQWIR